jgi:hypothetical protein
MRSPISIAAAAWVTVLLLGCASSPKWGGGSTAREERGIYESTVRYLIANYRTSRWTVEPDAYCLVVGRREAVARTMAERGPEWDPDPALLGILADIRPEVIPISECGRNDQVREVRRETGTPVVTLGVGYPRWSTPDQAEVDVAVRESASQRNAYTCTLRRNVDGWTVRRCL